MKHLTEGPFRYTGTHTVHSIILVTNATTLCMKRSKACLNHFTIFNNDCVRSGENLSPRLFVLYMYVNQLIDTLIVGSYYIDMTVYTSCRYC